MRGEGKCYALGFLGFTGNSRMEVHHELVHVDMNAFWYLTPKQIARYTPRSLNDEREEQDHKDRMKLEQARAAGYKSVFSNFP